MGEQSPEPNGYELLRGLADLREEVRGIGGRVVSTDVYIADQKAASDRVGRAESRLRDVEQRATDDEKSRKAREDEANKVKAQQRFTLAIALLGLIAAPIMAFIVSGGLVR